MTLPIRAAIFACVLFTAYGRAQKMLDVVRSGDVDKVKTLVREPSSLTERDAGTGRTPLHEAVSAGNVEMVRVLLAAGADPNAGDKRGVSAFDLGMASGNGAIAKLLIEARFKFSSLQVKQRPVHPAASGHPVTLYDFALRGDIGVVRMMLDMKADANSRAPDGSTALNAAALKGSVQIVELLLARGANVDSRTNAGSTPLHDAALGGNRQVVEMLLEHGAEMEARDSESKVTALYYAVQMERAEAAEALLRKGARTDVRNARGVSMLRMARENGFEGMVSLLKKYGAME